MITTNKSGFFAVVKIRHEQWQNWESMPMPMFLEVPFSMPVSMAMFFMESFSMAMPMSILFPKLYQRQCQWQWQCCPLFRKKQPWQKDELDVKNQSISSHLPFSLYFNINLSWICTKLAVLMGFDFPLTLSLKMSIPMPMSIFQNSKNQCQCQFFRGSQNQCQCQCQYLQKSQCQWVFQYYCSCLGQM